MVHFALSTDPMPHVIFWLNFCAWVAIWLGIVRRDQRYEGLVPTDQGSRLWIALSLWGGVLGAFVMAWMFPAAHMHGSGWVVLLSGLGLIWSGIALRLWAVRTLGRFFRTVVLIQEDHRLLCHGPYRLLRHPSYAGSLLTMAGFGLALGSWVSLCVIVLCPLVGFCRRIRLEESIMQAHFGDAYTAYARCTWRLVPLLW